MEKFIWDVQDIVVSSKNSYILVVLNNSDSNDNLRWMNGLLSEATKVVCVDSGLHFYHDYVVKKSMTGHPVIPLPYFISGDFDSVNSELLEFYCQKGVSVIHTQDQNATDFTKAIKLLSEKADKVNYIKVIAKVDSSRYDHIFGIIQSLFLAPLYVDMPVIVFCGASIYWLLPKGSHQINVPLPIVQSQDAWCGLIPIGTSVKVSTSGLKWNLDNGELTFGKLISSSNAYCDGSDGTVNITNSEPLLWTMGVPNIV